MPKSKQEQPTFEQAFQSLGAILEKLEAGDLSLEESISLYEQGMKLAEQCNTQLDTAELRVQKLSPDGQLADLDT
ncbi:MAG: exodeoxyribonuclease VII small subunit [Chloroflexota bacterium]